MITRSMRFILPFTIIALASNAGDGRIPIATAPFTINAPGTYYVTQDLFVSTGSVIYINASRVTVDLGGHTLTNSSTTGTNNGIMDWTSNHAIHIYNGTIIGGQNGISMSIANGGEYLFEDLAISGSGGTTISVGSNLGSTPTSQVTIRRVRIDGSGVSPCIQMQNVYGGEVSGSVLRGGTYGISVLTGHGITISDNQIVSNINAGLYLYGNSRNLNVTGNAIEQNGFTGIILNGMTAFRVERNTISGHSGAGVGCNTANNGAIADNVLTANVNGVTLSACSGIGLQRNTVNGSIGTGSSGNGFYLQSASSNNSFEGNVFTGNGASGININDAGSIGNIYGKNRFMNNGAANIFGTGNFTTGDNSSGGVNF